MTYQCLPSEEEFQQRNLYVFLSMSEELGHYVFSSALLFFGIGSGLALAFFWFGGVVGSLD